MDPVTAGILGASSIFGGMIGSQSQSATNKANFKLAQYQNEFNRQLWYEQQEYNNPTNTMQRLTDAGINPRAYQQLGQFANASNPPQMQRPEYESPFNSLSGMFNSLIQELRMQEQHDKDLEVKDSEIAKNKADANDKNASANARPTQSNLWTTQGDYYASLANEIGMKVLQEGEKHDLWRWLHGAKFDKDGRIKFGEGLYNYQGAYNSKILQDFEDRWLNSEKSREKMSSDITEITNRSSLLSLDYVSKLMELDPSLLKNKVWFRNIDDSIKSLGQLLGLIPGGKGPKGVVPKRLKGSSTRK